MALTTIRMLMIPKFIFPLPHSPLSFKLLYPDVYSLPLIYLTNISNFMCLEKDSGMYLSPVSMSPPLFFQSKDVQAYNLRVLLLTYFPFPHSHIQSVNKFFNKLKIDNFFSFLPPFLKCIYFSSSPMPTFLFQSSSSLLRTSPVVY